MKHRVYCIVENTVLVHDRTLQTQVSVVYCIVENTALVQGRTLEKQVSVV